MARTRFVDPNSPGLARTPNGDLIWYTNNVCHRNYDQPAVVGINGDQEWWFDGKRHRDNDQPAVIRVDGTNEWWIHGKRHRENDLPAVVNPFGRLKTFGFFNCIQVWAPDNYRNNKIGTQEWWVDHKLHRVGDNPAVICSDGSRFWCQNGEVHRDNDINDVDLPALVYGTGDLVWCKRGKIYRAGNYPAIMRFNGVKYFYRNGVPILLGGDLIQITAEAIKRSLWGQLWDTLWYGLGLNHY